MRRQGCKLDLHGCLTASAALVGVLGAASIASAAPPPVAAAADPLLSGFLTPPESAKPRTWWHWTNGNVSREGIEKDLAWMKQVGIGGLMLADVAYGGGQQVPTTTDFGTEAWYAAVRHTAEQAKRQGLEFALFSSPGWSLAGGPWVTPEQAMKRLVWSEIEIAGGRTFAGSLPQPPATEGPFRDLGRETKTPFYRDAAVVAYRVNESRIEPAELSSSAGPIDAAALLDDKLRTSTRITAVDGKAWVQIRYDRPFTARALTIGARTGIPVARLLASNDGESWRTVETAPGAQGYHGASARTFAFPAVTARLFRLELLGAARLPAEVVEGGPVRPSPAYDLTELRLFSEARVNRWEDKGAFGSLMNAYDGVPTPPAPAEAVVGNVVDLTGRMDADGTLRWSPPAGRWRVIRFGYANTGARNRPSVPAGVGLEVDKLNAANVAAYVDRYLAPVEQALGPLMGSFPSHVMMDSWEAGMQNWTDDLPAQFKARRGYDMTPYLPVLTGQVVNSAEVSDRFLWDFRRTLADMYADIFYATMDQEFGKRGLSSYSEASGVALEITEDTLRNKSKVDVPMAEFWVKALHPESQYHVDVRGAASAGHVFGKPIVAAEAFTGGGYESPLTLKRVADYWFAQGINRLVFHTSAHQPTDAKPGNTMVGSNINRNITWADQAGPLMLYFARLQHLLQQGQFVADIAYLLPQGAPATMPFWGAGLQPAPPKGHDYDFVNSDVLLDAETAPDGSIVLKSGMRYQLLALPPTEEMSVEVIRKLEQLVEQGAWIVGQRPRCSVGLSGYPASQAQVEEAAERLWGGMDGRSNTQHPVGKGMVFWGEAPGEILKMRGIKRDVDAPGDVAGLAPVPVAGGSADPGFAWIHRRDAGRDIYFVASQSDAPRSAEITFRVDDRTPELWNPVTGEVEAASYAVTPSGIRVTMDLAARQSMFVVFRAPLDRQAATPNRKVAVERSVLSGPWQVAFAPGLGAPAEAVLPALASWSEHSDPGIRFFSGTASYRRKLDVPRDWLRSGKKVFMDLGDVRDIAEVLINGRSLDLLWVPPFRLDLTPAVRAGANDLEIRVTNGWTNRIVGDKPQPEEQRVLKGMGKVEGTSGLSTYHDWKLVPSGLLGPVRISTE